MKNVAIYLRKSRNDGLDSIEDVLGRHERQLLEYCKNNQLTVCKVYKEVVSGDTIEHRPQMQALLEDVAACLYDGVVCMEIERLSRGNVIDQVEILDTFKDSGTKIYTLSKVYDLTKEEIDEEYFEFALFMSRREYKTIKRRLMRGMQQATKEGYYTGATIPYGFTKEKIDKGWVLVPDPLESEVVKDIFNKYVSGFGTAPLARYLNNNGIKPRYKNKWSECMVLNVIRNKNYIGLIHSSKLGVWYDGKHEGFIDRDLFETANLKLGHSPRTREKISNPLASILKCSVCGRTMLRKSNKRYSYLVCPGLDCPTHGAKLEKVESRLLSEVADSLQGFNYFLESPPKKTHEKEILSLENEIKKRQEMYVRVCEAFEKGVYTADIYKSRSDTLDAEIGAFSKRIEALKNEETDTARTRQAIPKLEKVLELYPSLDAEKKNNLLKTIIKEATYTRTDKGDFSLDIELYI